jgi:segregation and condensation protein A
MPMAAQLDLFFPRQEESGLALLLNMAKTGKIDPWNVDIAKVADQYLQAVTELKESDLKQTGKTLLYLAILLRMKSDLLAGVNFWEVIEDATADDIGLDSGELAPGELLTVDPFARTRRFNSLEEVLQRKTSTKEPRIRTVTLEDLIRELKKYEELERKRNLREKVEKVSNRRMTDYSQFTSDDIEELAHEEFLEDTIFVLKDLLDRVLIKQERVGLSSLKMDGKMDRISAFIALLFLDLRGEIEIFQEEFYGELFIRKAPHVEEASLPAETLEETA